MERILCILFLFLATGYCLLLFRLARGLRRLKPGLSTYRPTVSVIVAARNEAKTIRGCITKVLEQSYPADKLQLIVVDDRSEDETSEIVRDFVARDSRVQLIELRERLADFAPKKRAIDMGIQRASGEIIFTTDADCRPGPDWIAEMTKCFEHDVGMVIGFNPYEAQRGGSLFHELLALDYFAMASVGAAALGLGYPISCSGGNLAYRRDVYLSLGGFSSIRRWISGDDDLFLQMVREKTNYQIRYCLDPQAFVPTTPPASFEAFYNQRIRYASKCRQYAPRVVAGLIAVYTLNLFVLASPALLAAQGMIGLAGLGILLAKVSSEAWFLVRASRAFKWPFRMRVFLITALVHPPYIVVAGFLGQFARFTWHGERYAPRLRERPSLNP